MPPSGPDHHDLARLLAEWPYEPGEMNVRLVGEESEAPRIQVRLELGILQMETSGRPDGLRPEGHASACDLFRARSALDPSARLSADDCVTLRDEASQFHQRAVALLALGQWAGVVRDATRNLEAIDLCRERAAEPADRVSLERMRTPTLLLRTRARASAAVRDGQPRLALAAIDRGIAEIREALLARGEGERIDAAHEIQLLRGMRDLLVPRLPSSQRGELEARLRSAIAAENFELAAILRDELRQLP